MASFEIGQSHSYELFDNSCFQSHYFNDLDESSLKECLYQNNDYFGEGCDLFQWQEFPKYERIDNIKNNQNNIGSKPTIPKQSNQSNGKNENENDVIISENKYIKTKTKTKTGISLGRKRKNEDRKVYHTKYRSDNMMRKIKTYFMNFLYNYLNKSLTFIHKRFLKISKKINENLRKDFNILLMQMTVREIFEQYGINGRYGEYKKRKNINQALISEIYKKNEEIETIKILNSKYIDILRVLRTKYLEKFSSDLFEKEIKSGESIEDAEAYVNDLKELLYNYEDWFEKKSGRKKI